MAFRLSDSEYEMIRWAANVRGLSISEYVRACAIERAGQALMTMTNYHPVVSTTEVDRGS